MRNPLVVLGMQWRRCHLARVNPGGETPEMGHHNRPTPLIPGFGGHVLDLDLDGDDVARRWPEEGGAA